MFHITSGSYRVLEIDYAYQALTLHEPHMSTCDTVVLGGQGNGFALEEWRSPYFNPTPDNVFMLIGCSAQSPLFQGFPGKHLPCRNVSEMGCEEAAWIGAANGWGARRLPGLEPQTDGFGSAPVLHPSVARWVSSPLNLTRLECEGRRVFKAHSLALVRMSGPGQWAYGIRVKYSVQGNDEFCSACEVTGGACGYGSDGVRQLCMCGTMNSTSNLRFR